MDLAHSSRAGRLSYVCNYFYGRGLDFASDPVAGSNLQGEGSEEIADRTFICDVNPISAARLNLHAHGMKQGLKREPFPHV